MKKTIIILTLFLILTSCGDDKSAASSDSSNKSTSSHKSDKKAGKILACSVLSKDYIQSKYTGAEITMLNEGGRTYPLCSARFKFENAEYDISLTLGVIGGADEATLEQSVSYFKKKGSVEDVSGVGEKAYNRTGNSGQISALNNGNLIHVSAYKDNKYDLELAKNITNSLFKEL
jgi:hypothetical protein